MLHKKYGKTIFRLGFLRVAQLGGGGGGECPRPITLKLLMIMILGLLQNQIQKLQGLQNSAARLVTRTKKSERITLILINLHWLPVQQRIIFKLLLNTYKALKGMAPDYLSTLLTVYKPARSLRSSAAKNLSVPKSRTTTYGDRSFAYACPKRWNQLPQHIKLSETLESFKSRLKTHLFKIAFDVWNMTHS